MKTSPFGMSAPKAVVGILMLVTSMTAMSQVSFPSDPKTVAECNEPALKMSALRDRELERQRQESKAAEARDYNTGGEKYRALMDLLAEHGRINDRMTAERRALENACRAAAYKNEQVTARALREMQETYNKAKQSYEQARAIIERIRNSPADAYVKRNEAHSPELESRMNDAKSYIMAFQSKSEIVSGIQDASFFQMKSQMQQLNGDMLALESMVQSERSNDSANPGSPANRPVASAENPGGNPAEATGIAALFQQNLSQARNWLSRTFQAEPNPASGDSVERAQPAPEPGTPAPRTQSAPAAAPPPNTPEQRMAAARAQCAASESTCQSACMGVAALGLLSLFTRNNAAATEASNQTQQCSNRCDEAKNSCEQQANAMAGGNQQAAYSGGGGGSGGGSTPNFGSARGLPVDECHRQANASDLGNKLNAIPRNETVLLLRGAIFNLDFLIGTYTQCLPDQKSQQAINGWKTQREQSLRTCRQISSVDNCLKSPF